jgi:hypothetical protein
LTNSARHWPAYLEFNGDGGGDRHWDVFSKGRDFGAWLGLVPKQISTGGRTILGSQSPARCVTCEARAHRCASRGCPATRTAGNAGPGYGDAPRQQERTDLIDDSDTLTEQSIADAVQRLKVELIGCLDCDEFHGRALDSLGEGFRIGSRSSIPSNTGARISPASGGRRGQAFGVWG